MKKTVDISLKIPYGTYVYVGVGIFLLGNNRHRILVVGHSPALRRHRTRCLFYFPNEKAAESGSGYTGNKGTGCAVRFTDVEGRNVAQHERDGNAAIRSAT